MKRLPLLAAALLASASLLSHAELRRGGFLGLAVENQDGKLVVRGTAAGGSSAAAGIEAGDIVTRLDGKPVGAAGDFVTAARAMRAGDVAAIDVVRAGSPLLIRVPVNPKPLEVAPPGLDVAYGDVSVDGHLRRTLFTAPQGKAARLPAVLFVTGIGCFSQEITDPREPVAQLLHGVSRAGFATMRVEKGRQGDSQGPACDSPAADLEAEVRGYVAGLRALKHDPRVDPDKVFIVGLSIGGVEAPLIEREEKVRGVVAINTAAKPFMEYWIEAMRRQRTLGGMPPDEVDAITALGLRCSFPVLIQRETPQDVLKRSPECREEVDFPAPHTFMQQWAALNVAQAWKRVDSPVLVVIGKSDFIATYSDSPYLVDMLNGYRPGRATLRPIEGMDHYMTKAPSMKASMERKGPAEFEPAVLRATVEWLQQQLGPG